MQKKDAQQVRGISADGLQDGQHIHALLEVSMHGHGHADCAQHHRYETNQAEDRGGVVETLAQAGIALAEVHHLRVGQRRLDLLAQATGSASAGSFISNRWLARLPGAMRPVRTSAACEIITRGPMRPSSCMRSGSCLNTAAILKVSSAQAQRTDRHAHSGG